MTCKSWHPWYTFGGLEQGYWCCFAGGINQKFSSVCDASCLCQWLSRCKNSTVFEGCIFKPHDFTLQMPISAHEDPHSLYYLWCHWFEWSYTILTPTTRAGKRDLSWAWIRQIGQRKNAKWTSKIDQKIDYLPIHVPCTFYWKSINSQPLQFLLKLFPLSGSLVIIYCPAQPQKIINEERIAKELRRRTKWNVKVSTFCLLAVPELQKLMFSIRKCLTYKQCGAFKFGLLCFFLAR